MPDPDPVVYLPVRAAPPVSAALVVRARVDAAAIGPLLRGAVRAIDPDLPLYRLMPMEQALAESQWNGRISQMLLDTIVFVAMTLAAIGLYTVTACAVAQRMQEIGVRVALGARSPHLVALVLRRASMQLGLGFAAGIGLTAAFDRAISGQWSAMDPVTLLAVGVLLALATALASLAPIGRALRVDPATVLRRA